MAKTATRAAGPVSKLIGARIRAARLEIGLSQTALAEAAGVTFQQVQKYENGVNRVSPDRLQLIATKMRKPITYFFLDGPVAEALEPVDCETLDKLIPWMMSRPSAGRALSALSRLNEADTKIIAGVAERLASGRS